MIVLGLNAYHGDASAALFVDGELVAAIEEERLNRIKHSGGFPTLAVRACLAEAGLSLSAVDHVAVSRDPRAHVLRKGLYVAERAARSLVAADAERAAFFSSLLQRADNRKKLGHIERDLCSACESASLRAPVHAVEHHRAHLGSAFFASGFGDAAVLSLDGFGDFVSTMWGRGIDTKISVEGEVTFPHSLGVLYTAICQWLGFVKYGDEGKVMGLAAYGRPRLLPRMRSLISLSKDGGFALGLRYFRHHREGVDMTFLDGTPAVGRLYSPALIELLGAPRVPGAPDAAQDELAADVAASLQALLEEAVLHIANGLSVRTNEQRLCLAGGVALNSVANGRILDATRFRELFVQPAAGDNGTSLGAALWVMHHVLGQPRRFVMRHAYTGPQFDEGACAQAIRSVLGSAPESVGFSVEKLSETALIERAVSAIAEGAILGWFQGRMEFGPRALGHRSILCDPRRPEMKDILNRRIKHRESFRPFAPAILEEATAEWFERAAPSPAMLLVDRIRPSKQAEIPAVTHADGTGRLQTVSKATSPQFYALIRAFAARTGVPVVLNTSFNEHEPIVCTPEEALRCFEKTHMDALALGPFFITRR